MAIRTISGSVLLDHGCQPAAIAKNFYTVQNEPCFARVIVNEAADFVSGSRVAAQIAQEGRPGFTGAVNEGRLADFAVGFPPERFAGYPNGHSHTDCQADERSRSIA